MRHRTCALAGALAGLAAFAPASDAAASWAVSAFGGVLLDNTWDEVFHAPHSLDVQQSGLAGLGAAVEVWRPTPALGIEVEGQIVRHFGDQTHWEVNAPLITATWSAFPWSERLGSYAAFGIGPSFASEEPALEAVNNRSTDAVLVYWKIEFGVDLPPEGWSLFARLHHRSTGYGLMGDAGGANALALGLRRGF